MSQDKSYNIGDIIKHDNILLIACEEDKYGTCDNCIFLIKKHNNTICFINNENDKLRISCSRNEIIYKKLKKPKSLKRYL